MIVLEILSIAALIGLMAVVHSIANRGSWTGIDVSDRPWPIRKILRWWYRIDDNE